VARRRPVCSASAVMTEGVRWPVYAALLQVKEYADDYD
jgi:hypothetical protein